jgi:hypothetical protein
MCGKYTKQLHPWTQEGEPYIEVGGIAAVVHKTVIKRLGNQLMTPVGVQAGGDDAVRFRAVSSTVTINRLSEQSGSDCIIHTGAHIAYL